MPETIFDLIQVDFPPGKEGYLELSKNAPQPKEKSFLNDIADYSKTFLKGSIEGLGRLGRMMGPLETGKPNQQQLEEQTESLDALLPTDEGYVQRGLRRGLRETPSMMAFPGSGAQALPRTITAGFIGEGAKELGAPEWAQSALELTAFVGPDITKKLLSSGNDKDIIEAAKRFGFTDEQITPLIQSYFKQKWLSKLTPRRGATEKALRSTKEALSESYGTLQKSKNAAKEISEVENGRLINSIRQQTSKMPSAVRDKIEKDLDDLLSNKITGDTLINFYSDIGHYLGDNTKQLSLLKETIKKSLGSLSPELANDFDLINKLYTKYYPIASKLKPTLTSDIISAAEAIGAFGGTLGVVFGHYPTLVTILGEQLAKKMSQQMLINPHFQQLSRKMVVALNQNKYGLAQKVTNDIRKELAKFSPEAAAQIKNFSEKDFEKLLSNHPPETDE